MCSYLLDPGKGEPVLDICAGLGGKSIHIAELMEDKGRMIALDISHSRLVRLSQSLYRLGTGCIDPVVADAGNQLSSLFSCLFDKIFIDAPCSGLGTISKHPDGKWTRDPDDIIRLSRLQRNILNEAVPLLRSGGKILYVTCAISREENEEVVYYFLKNNRTMVQENLKEHIPQWGIDLIDDQGFLRTFPHIHRTDGFFGALFSKRY